MIENGLGISKVRIFQLIVLVIVIVAVSQGMNYRDKQVESPSESIESEEITSTDYLGKVYVYQLLDNGKVELNLPDGYERIEYSANIYYTDNMGLQSGTFGGGSSSKAQDMDYESVSLSKENPSEKIEIDSNATVAVIDFDLDSTELNENRLPHDETRLIYSFVFLMGVLILICSEIILRTVRERKD